MIGYEPRHSLDDILTQVIEYFRGQVAVYWSACRHAARCRRVLARGRRARRRRSPGRRPRCSSTMDDGRVTLVGEERDGPPDPGRVGEGRPDADRQRRARRRRTGDARADGRARSSRRSTSCCARSAATCWRRARRPRPNASRYDRILILPTAASRGRARPRRSRRRPRRFPQPQFSPPPPRETIADGDADCRRRSGRPPRDRPAGHPAARTVRAAGVQRRSRSRRRSGATAAGAAPTTSRRRAPGGRRRSWHGRRRRRPAPAGQPARPRQPRPVARRADSPDVSC